MVTKGADLVGQSVAMLDKIEIVIRSLTKRQNDLTQELQHLYSLGFTDAKPHYRDGKYLYLIHPMENGERKREYIGADPGKIQDALDMIERKGKVEELERQLDQVVSTISSINYYISQAIATGYSVRW